VEAVSEKTPLTALATQALFEKRAARFGDAPRGLSASHHRRPRARRGAGRRRARAAVSATGSTRMGRAVGPRVAARFGRAILELGGNNAAIVAPTADLDLAVRGIAFARLGTAGQRCTTLRRVFVHAASTTSSCRAWIKAYGSGAGRRSARRRHPGRPADRQAAFDGMQGAGRGRAPRAARWCTAASASKAGSGPDAWYVRPAWSSMPAQTPIVVCHETFAPILYVLRYTTLRRGHRAAQRGAAGPVVVHLHQRPARGRALPVGAGSDCGIANVNIGPAAPRSAAPSAARRRPAAAARRLGRLEGLHAPRHQHGQLRPRAAAGAGRAHRDDVR
jgi:aldehyde dehydrogenase (NAD+)